MNWRLRFLALSIRGSAERTALRVLAVVVAAVTSVVFMVLIGALALSVLSTLWQKRLDQRWADTVATPTRVLEEVAPRGPNPSALRLVQAAAVFGIELFPTSDVYRPTKSVRRIEHSTELKTWCDALMTGSAGPVSPVPNTVRLTLEERSDALTEIIAGLTDSDPPTWELQSATGGGAPTPSALVELHRWLVAAAADSANQGDESRAMEAIEAAWLLNLESLRRPERRLRLAAYSNAELELALLRKLPGTVTAATWLERLDTFDPSTRLDEWVLIEAYSLPASTKRGTVLDDDGLWPLAMSLIAEPVRRWLLMPASESLQVGTAALSAANLATLDPDLLYVDAHHRIPRWNRVARAALPNPWDESLYAARSGLAVQLTAEALRLGAQTEEQSNELVATLPKRQISRVPGAIWMWTAEPEAIRIRLVVEEAPVAGNDVLATPPLEHVVQVM